MGQREDAANAQTAGRTAPRVRRPAAPGQRPTLLFGIVAGFAPACRRAGLAALPIALAVLMAVPMPGAPQVIGPCDGNCPRFSSTASLTFRISEGTGSGDVIAMLPAAMDADQDDRDIVYALWDRDDPVENGDRDETSFGDGDAAAFSIGEEFVSGENDERIKTLMLQTRSGHDYDYESNPPKRSYRFRLVACDNQYNRAYVDVTVHIDNVNEDLGRPDAPEVEGVSTSKLVVRWTAPSNTGPPIHDYDLQYRKSGTTDAWRSWSHSGTQTNAVITGLQAGTAYEAQVLARNGEGVSAWSPSGIGSTLTAGNNPPVFLDASPAARSFAENTPAGRNVGRPVRAEGESTLTYSLGGADADSFDFVPSSGQIRTKAGVTYDFEAKPAYAVTVTATDQNPNSSDATMTVAITLDDVDEPPLRPAAPVVATSRGGDTILDVTWSAPDSTGRPAVDDYDLRYRRIAGAGQNCRNWCAWEHTGSTTATAIVDLDSGTRYEVQVLARSHEGESPWSPSGSGWTNTQGNTIPTFDDGASTTRSVPENTAAGQPVGAPVAATDGDANDTVTYLLEGVDARFFSIDSGSGQIRTRSGVTYDHEARDTYSVAVKATDSSHVGASIAVTIMIEDVDEPPNAPARPTVRGHSTRSLSVSWRAPSNAGRPEIESYDLQYREGTSGDWLDGPQDVTETNAVIRDATPALEPGTSYQVQVRATNDEGDGAWSPPGSGRTLAPPTFPAGPLTRSFRENTPAGENVGAPVRATFAGTTLTYSLEGTGDGGSFDIDEETGQIKTKADQTYDYETKNEYTVTVKASDASDASATVEVEIELRNVNEPPLAPGTPVVTAATTASLTVAWTAPDNTGRPDIDGYDLQYRKNTSGSWGSWSNLRQDGTGTSTTISDLDPDSLYQVQVRATNADGNGPYSQPGAGWTTGGSPGTPPTFEDGASATRSFPENTPPNRPIGDPVTATPANTGDTLTYSLEGTDAASFTVDFDTGQLRTRSGVTYDYEARSPEYRYSVTVRATDSSNASAMILVTIHITDVVNEGGGSPVRTTTESPSPDDEETPDGDEQPVVAGGDLAFEEGASATRGLPENTPPGRDVGTPVTASPAAGGGPLAYMLEGVDAGSFDIEPKTGQIRTKAGVTYDYETRDTYTVTVKATGPAGLSGTIDVTINVLDVDEKPATPEAPTVHTPDGTNTRLLASWTAPDLQGGPPLTDYDVQYRQGATGDWVDWQHDGIATVTAITALAPGTAYQVRVRALNDEAASDWSPPGSGRTNTSLDRWLGRFGHSVAQQMMHGVAERLASLCRTGLQGAVAGHGFGGDRHLTPRSTAYRLTARDGSRHTPPVWAAGDPATEGSLVSGTGRALLLAGTEFELGSKTSGSGIACVWGRGAYSSFHGRDGSWSLDGNVSTGTLGADYARGPWTVGLALAHSRGEGRSRQDDVEAALTGLYPYAGYRVTERFSVWGLGGIGRGGLTVTPESGLSAQADLGLVMIAAGARSLLVTAASGMNVALETDSFWVRTASDAAPGLLASQADAKGLRFGLESSYRVALKNGGRLTPKVEAGLRYDGGGAETGLGVDVGVGLLWSAPMPGVSAEIAIRRVLMHEATGFNDWSVSGLVRYDPNPFSERGVSLAFRSAIGPPSLDGANALLDRETAAGLASSNTSHGGQLTAEAAYGFPILGGRFTGAPWVGAGLLGRGRDYRIGYRISPASLSGSHVRVGIEGMRRENGGGRAETEHAIGVRFGLGW